MTHCKLDGSRRLIADWSWTPGESVNSRTPDNMFDGHMGILKYPSIDHIVDAIAGVGKDALMLHELEFPLWFKKWCVQLQISGH